MGKKKYLEYISKLFEKSAVVDFTSINRIASHGKQVKHYAKQIVNRLIKQGKIYKIGKGLYSSISESSLAVFGFTPAYLGLQDALSFHNLWEQETNPVIITTNNIRQGVRKVFGNNILLRRITPKYFFGMEYVKEGELYIPVSDIEKTFIDMVYFRKKIDKEMLKSFKEKIDAKKLKDYLKKYPVRISNRVLSKIK